MIFRFAFKNVMRHRKRSLLTAVSIFFAAMISGIAQGWINGITGVYEKNYTKYQTGHVRVSTEEFARKEKFMPVDELIASPGALVETLSEIPGVQSIEERIRFGILLGREDITVASIGMGVDLEKTFIGLKEKIVEGSISHEGIYIGAGLAKKLGIKTGEDLLIAAKTAEGGLNGIKLRVQGIFRLGMMYDKNYFFISLADAKKLLKIHDAATEILIYAEDPELTAELALKTAGLLAPGLKAETYMEQMGSFYSTLQSTKSYYIFLEMLILFLASFVIINTMMMAIFERMKEIGALKAMGMSDRELFANFTLEGAILGAAGGLPGAVCGFILIYLAGLKGLDFTSELRNLEMPFEYILRPEIKLKDLAVAVIISICVPALSAMIPARYAKKLMPADALKK